MAILNFTECPECGETVAEHLLEKHQEIECTGEQRTCGMCGEPYDNYTYHITGGCPGTE